MSTCLLGKVIVGMKIADDKEALLFELADDESVVARADGDCCSHSWVEHVELPALGFPATVLSQEDLGTIRDSEEHDYDHIKFYGYKIVTDRGEIVIDYRNSSNGYYGGDLVWPDDGCFYGGVFGQNKSSEIWQEIPK